MRSRYVLALSLSLITISLFAAAPADAVKIDPELRAAMSDKNGDLLPVLMVYDNPVSAEDLVLELDRLSPEKRRKKVLEALKKKSQKIHRNAIMVLDDPENRPQVEDVTHLYMAGALAFRASSNVVEQLGGLMDNAILCLDKSYDLTSATTRGAIGGPDKAARADTVWSVKFINADDVWNQLGLTGDGVLVGHIDSGVDVDHPDLVHRIWNNADEIPGNGIDDDGNGFVDDWRGWDFGDDDNNPNDDGASPGHGTHTAGTVAGDGTNGTQTGVAPGATIMPCKAFANDGSGTLGMVWASQQYCVENGARVITMSLGIPGEVPASYMRNERVNCANIRDAGVIFFNSAGNDHYEYDPPIELGLSARVPAPWIDGAAGPANLGGTITVGGTGYLNNSVYGSSSRGPAKWDDVDPFNDWPYNPGNGLIKPDIAAPGVGVNSTTVGGGYSGDSWSGTSMACPHAAGLAALMLEKNPSLSPAGVDSLMELNAIDLGVTGKDNAFGSGRIDALAIVNATPTSQSADLVQSGLLPDPAGDGVLDPGETSELAIELTNVSTVVDAVGVTAGLDVVSNPYVTVNDGYAVFPDVPLDGGTSTNVSSAFTLDVGSDAPQGYAFTMLLTVNSGAYFTRTFEIDWYVGLPDWRTHNIGDIFLTVTDQGIIGYMDQNQAEGEGMGLADGGSGLYVGSFWLADDPTYVCNRDFGGGDLREWVVNEDPNGRVADLGSEASDQTFKAIFNDGAHPSPRDVVVDQTSFAFSGIDENNFVILEYKVSNNGTTDMATVHNGVFCDFDIGDSGTNLGGTDVPRNLTYMYASGGPYFGIALLGGPNTAANTTLINNPTYVYPDLHVDDGFKVRFLRGVINVPTTPAADDWSALTSNEISLMAGQSATSVYALVAGETLEEIQDAVDAANAAYNPSSAVSTDNPVKLFRLAQNHPNPFNPVTNIKFSVANAGHVELAVYDLSGRLVRTLISETRGAGDHEVLWDGKDQSGGAVPSGMYFYRFTSDGETTARKMTLVK